MGESASHSRIGYAAAGALAARSELRSRLMIVALVVSIFPPVAMVGAIAFRLLELRVLERIDHSLASQVFGLTVLASWPLGLILGIFASMRETRPFGLPHAAIVLLSAVTPLLLVLLAFLQ